VTHLRLPLHVPLEVRAARPAGVLHDEEALVLGAGVALLEPGQEVVFQLLARLVGDEAHPV